MNAAMVCVDFSDLLALTLPYNRHHFDRVLIVTDYNDAETVYVAEQNGAEVWRTNSFYKSGAYFNKWLALEEALDVKKFRPYHSSMADPFICLMDVDVVWPKSLGNWKPKQGYIQGPLRRMKEDIWTNPVIPPESEWSKYALHPQQQEIAGFSQIFSLFDIHVHERPWNDTGFVHAGSGDSHFQQRWPSNLRDRPPWQCLHLGPAGKNWYGRSVAYSSGDSPQNARLRIALCHEIWVRRRHNRASGKDIYSGERVPPQS